MDCFSGREALRDFTQTLVAMSTLDVRHENDKSPGGMQYLHEVTGKDGERRFVADHDGLMVVVGGEAEWCH